MGLLNSSAVVGSLIFGSLLIAGSAGAIALPDSSSCSAGGGACLQITASSGSTASRAIVGSNNVGFGVLGLSVTGDGVAGQTTGGGGVAVYGLAQNNGVAFRANADTNNAVLAFNGDTTQAAATISAISGGNSGLAYYGIGGIIISGGAWKPGGGMWLASSDARVKDDVRSLHWGLEELREIRPVTYKYNGLGGTTNDGHEYVGVIAQELEKVLPSMVSSRRGKLHESDAKETDIKTVDPSAFTYVLINAVKEQQEIIDRQEHRIASLEHGRGASLSASILGGGVGMGLAIGLLPLGWVALLRRKGLKASS